MKALCEKNITEKMRGVS